MFQPNIDRAHRANRCFFGCSAQHIDPGIGSVAGHEEDQPKSKGHALAGRVVDFICSSLRC